MTYDPETIHVASRNMIAAGFAIALVANVWRKNWVYSLFLFAAIIESFKRYRYQFHNWFKIEMLGPHDRYEDKIVLQSKLMYVAIMLFCASVLLLIPYMVRANSGRRLMVLGTFMALVILSLELISPHYIDVIIFHPVGLFAIAAIGYFISGLLIAGGAILDRRP